MLALTLCFGVFLKFSMKEKGLISSSIKSEYIEKVDPRERISPERVEKKATRIRTLDSVTIKKMMNKSFKPNKDIALSELRLIEVTYLGFDKQAHKGELVVNKKVAKEVTLIFDELYEAKFQIEKIDLVDCYGADDEKSMEANNTSCFNYRKITGGKSLSNHGLGLAIDINPMQNPYVYGKRVLPSDGRDYLDRKRIQKGMIYPGGACYKIFKRYGWNWGGDWKKPKDYQHFFKEFRKE